MENLLTVQQIARELKVSYWVTREAILQNKHKLAGQYTEGIHKGGKRILIKKEALPIIIELVSDKERLDLSSEWLTVDSLAWHLDCLNAEIYNLLRKKEIPDKYIRILPRSKRYLLHRSVIDFLNGEQQPCLLDIFSNRQTHSGSVNEDANHDTIAELIEKVIEKEVQKRLASQQKEIESRVMEALKKMLK